MSQGDPTVLDSIRTRNTTQARYAYPARVPGVAADELGQVEVVGHIRGVRQPPLDHSPVGGARGQSPPPVPRKDLPFAFRAKASLWRSQPIFYGRAAVPELPEATHCAEQVPERFALALDLVFALVIERP
jgi:hypothetical protein